MDSLGINKQFDEMWNRRHGRKQAEMLLKRQLGPVKEYSASVVIQRFFEKVSLERQRKRNAKIIASGTEKDEMTDMYVTSISVK